VRRRRRVTAHPDISHSIHIHNIRQDD
jgi:hypothetical protein